MPAYHFKCTTCGHQDQIIAATFENKAVCPCGGTMWRIDPVELPNIPTTCAWCLSECNEKSPPGVSHGICQRHKDELLKEVGL